MTRAMYDSVTAARLPANATLVAAYIDGHYANEAAVRARCPHATVVTITTRAPGKPGAKVADVETDDLTPEQGAQWAANEVKAGRRPTIYCNESTWPEVKRHVAAHGITVSYWIAHYDTGPTVIPGSVAHQWQERTDQNLDYSIAADYWPGVDPAPVKAEAEAASKPTVVGAHPAYPGHVLHHGMTTDPAVDSIQRYFHLPVTRRFDDALAAKVAEFRRTHRIPGAAEVDAAVWRAMFP